MSALGGDAGSDAGLSARDADVGPTEAGSGPADALDLACTSCGCAKRASELDRLLWCEGCLARARERAKRAGWGAGVVLAGALALWIYLVQQPSRLVIGGWAGAVAATLWLGAKAARELCFGLLRLRGRPLS